MKKIFIISILIIGITKIYSITPSVTFGTQRYSINGREQGQFYVDIALTQPIGNLSLYGKYRNEMNPSKVTSLRFAPVQDYYTVGAFYEFDFATIRLEHMCIHPVVSNNGWEGLQGGYTRFELTFGE